MATVARVVIGDDAAISQLLDRSPHAGALALVTVSATAEDTPQLAFGMLARSLQTGTQGLLGMGKVDHCGCTSIIADKFLHASRNRLQIF